MKNPNQIENPPETERVGRVRGRSGVIHPNHRRIYAVMGFLFLGAAHATPPTLDQWPNPSLSGSPWSDPSSGPLLHLPGNLSVGTSYVENAFGVDAAPRVGGRNGISKIAKAYLDYTFFSRRSGNLPQNFQGRLGIANKTLDIRELGMPMGDAPPGRFGGLDVGMGDNWERESDSGLMASLEWRLDAPGFADKPAFDDLTWGDILQVSFFADYGKAFSNSATLTNAEERELGIGTGLRFLLPGRLTANLQAAYALDSWEKDGIAANGEGADADRTRFRLDFSYNF